MNTEHSVYYEFGYYKQVLSRENEFVVMGTFPPNAALQGSALLKSWSSSLFTRFSKKKKEIHNLRCRLRD